MTIQRLSHIGICVSELSISKTFYQKVFGYQEVSNIKIGGEADALLDLRDTDLDAVYMQRPGEDTRIELLFFRTPSTETNAHIRAINLVGLTHLSFRVENLTATVNLVEQYGGRFLENTLTENTNYQMKAAMITDPDGLRIELLQAPGDPNYLPGQS